MPPRRGAALALVGVLLLAAPLDAHIPHDAVYSTASAPLPGGVEVLCSIAGNETVIISWDSGLTFQTVTDGLETESPVTLRYHPDGRFLVGTRSGAWRINPQNGRAQKLCRGLPNAGVVHVRSIAVPDHPGEPAFLLESSGSLYRSTTNGWDFVNTVGALAGVGRIALAPGYRSGSPTGPGASLACTAGNRLLLSEDHGASWQTVTSQHGLVIGVAYARDYAISQVLLVGLESGHVLRSADAGQTFLPVLRLESWVSSILPGEQGRFFVSGGLYPNYPGFTQGIFRSDDNGLTWDDFGNHPSFELEHFDGITGDRSLGLFSELSFGSARGADGVVYLSRLEGLWRSRDAGITWRQQRPRSHRETRGVDIARDPVGGARIFAATYGAGPIMKRVDPAGHSEEASIGAGCILNYFFPGKLSPSFDLDGFALAGGAFDLVRWNDNKTSPISGSWSIAPVLGVAKNQSRRLAFSPHFDASLGSQDQSWFWSYWGDNLFHTPDAGETAGAIDAAAPISKVYSIGVAPDYDASTQTGVFVGSDDGSLYKLVQGRWQLLLRMPGNRRVGTPVVAPDYATSRILFVTDSWGEGIWEVYDQIAGPALAILRSTGLPTSRVSAFAISPDFATDGTYFCGTWGWGVFGHKRGQNLWWEPVGEGFPRYWVQDLAISPNYTEDRLLAAGTQRGVFSLVDLGPGSQWKLEIEEYRRDDTDPGFTTFTASSAPMPEHWHHRSASSLGALCHGDGVLVTDEHAAFIEADGLARRVRVQTYRGPGQGMVQLRAYDLATLEQVGNAVTADLRSGTSLEPFEAVIDIATPGPVRVRAIAVLPASQEFLFDGMVFEEP